MLMFPVPMPIAFQTAVGSEAAKYEKGYSSIIYINDSFPYVEISLI